MKFPRLSPFSRATPEGNLTRAHQAANTSCSPELAHPPKGKNYCPLGPASYAYHLPLPFQGMKVNEEDIPHAPHGVSRVPGGGLLQIFYRFFYTMGASLYFFQ